MLRSTILLFAATIITFSAHPVPGNPSNRQADAGFDLHNIQDHQDLATQAQELCERCRKYEAECKEKGAKVSVKSLGEMHICIDQLRRIALDLQLHGETAGADYDLRADYFTGVFDLTMQAFKRSPAAGPQIAKIRAALESPRSRQRESSVPKQIAALLQKEQLQKAYELLYETVDPLAAQASFLSATDYYRYLRAYDKATEYTVGPRNRALREQAVLELEEAAAALAPDPEALLNEMAAALSMLRTSPTANAGGQAMSGPQCLDYFAGRWSQVQWAALQCRAVDASRRASLRNPDYGQIGSQKPNRIAAERYAEFCANAANACAAIIDADAARAAGDQAAQLYLAYLRTLPPILANTKDGQLEAAVTVALARLAAKSPPLQADVQAYRAATDDVLRWRAKAAAAAASAQASKFKQPAALLTEVMASTREQKLLLAESPPKLDEAHLLECAPEVLRLTSPKLIEQRASIADIVTPVGGRFGIARYQQRHYGMIPAQAFPQQIADLKEDLMVTDQQPPLSLQAAVAVYSAERGCYEQAGGIIKGVTLEGVLPRFAALPATASVLVPLGPLPSEPDDARMLDQVLVLLAIEPQWVQHRYFFSELAVQ